MELSILYFLVSGSAITDLCRNKIFNKWLLIGIIGAGLLSVMGVSQDPPAVKIMRAFLTLAILIPVYVIGGLGGGDVKLFAVIALFLSSEELIIVMVMSFLIGSVIGIIKIIRNKKIGQTIHFALPMLISVLLVTNSQGMICF